MSEHVHTFNIPVEYVTTNQINITNVAWPHASHLIVTKLRCTGCNEEQDRG